MDLLMSGDVFVADATATLSTLIDTLGIPEPRASWRQHWDRYGFDAYWCRIGPDFAAAPTRLEVICPTVEPEPDVEHPHMQELFDSQGQRPVKAHSTPISVPDIDQLATKLADRGARFRLDPPIAEMPFARIWMGLTTDEPTSYESGSDGGLRLEFLPTEALGLPRDASSPEPPVLGPPDGAYVGVAARVFVVTDLDATMASLAQYLDWAPSSLDEADPRGRVAQFSFSFARSGVIEVIQPRRGSEAAAFVERWGSGPLGIRLSVNGLDQRIDLLRRRGTPLDLVDRRGVSVAVVDPKATAHTCFELVEHEHRR